MPFQGNRSVEEEVSVLPTHHIQSPTYPPTYPVCRLKEAKNQKAAEGTKDIRVCFGGGGGGGGGGGRGGGDGDVIVE